MKHYYVQYDIKHGGQDGMSIDAFSKYSAIQKVKELIDSDCTGIYKNFSASKAYKEKDLRHEQAGPGI